MVALATGTAHADVSEAERAFERGREALRVGNYKRACQAFAESQELEPSADTQFHIALCSEQLGKLGTALALHRELARRDDYHRKDKAAELAEELEYRVPRLELDVRGGADTGPPDGLVVSVNGIAFVEPAEVPLDLGPNRIVATAPGFQRWTREVSAIAEHEVKRITIDLEEDPDAQLADSSTLSSSQARGAAAPRRSSQRTIGLVTLVAGAFLLGGGFTSGVLAQSRWDQVQDLCPGGTCATRVAYDQAIVLRDEARLRGNLATVLVITGGAAAIGGLVLWATAPATRGGIAVTPSTDGSSAYLTLGGWF